MKRHVSLVSDFNYPCTYKQMVGKGSNNEILYFSESEEKSFVFTLIANFKLVQLCFQMAYAKFTICCLFLESSENQTFEGPLWK